MSQVVGAPPLSHPTVEERTEVGKAARRRTTRSSHAEWQAPAGRRDPITVLEEQARTREPVLVPIRYGRMAESPFAFYRGAAAVMAADLASTPNSGIPVQLCGDAHLSNFGGFAAPDRRLIFDINDFDETLPGPWEWDVKRLAASLEVAGRERGMGFKPRGRIVRRAIGRYREDMRKFAEKRNLDVWYSRLDLDEAFESIRDSLDREQVKLGERSRAKALRKDSLRAYSKLATEPGNGDEPRLISDPPLIVPLADLADQYGVTDVGAVEDQLRGLIRDYRVTLRSDLRRLLESYHYVDLAHKVVGVGSVGTRAWIVLLLGRDHGDPLFLQVKEAQRSVLEPFLQPSAFENQGERVVVGQRLMQAASDLMLGWLRARGVVDGQPRDFYVRQLWDHKLSFDVDAMKPEGFEAYAGLCGAALAAAHARSGDRIAISAYLGASDRFDRAISEFAARYADQSEKDYSALLEAIKSGRVEAQRGV
jgi:uncharacterized protein (DUF2252 family)